VPAESPTELRFASTVLLLRDAPAAEGRSHAGAPIPTELEVFMARRHADTVFVGGGYVFPGGRVDPDDAIDPAFCAGIDEATASQRLGLPKGGLAYFVAAIRECFEEAGVLLAYDRSGSLLDFADPQLEAHFKALRDRLNAGDVSIQQIAEREQLRLATDRIEYWSHWITPKGEPRRYDTRFFVTVAPESQTAAHDDWELTGSAWVTPREALARGARREWKIIFPTLRTLEALDRHETAAAAIAWAARQPLPLPANQPRVFGGRVVLPGDDGYAEGETDLS
jgi:8-oxo-dGTP pyrophosphatase MutT (NUDIX family)